MSRNGYTFRRVKAGLHEIRGTDYRLTRSTHGWDLHRGDDLIEMHVRTVQDASAYVRFVEEVEAHLRKLGAVPVDRYSYPWDLETSLGRLRVHVHGSWVAMRFDDVDRASKKLTREYHGLNTYSGKWNFHTNGSDVDAEISAFKRKLSLVIE